MIISIFKTIPQTNGPVILLMLPASVIDLIGQFWGRKIKHDAPKRDSELTFDKTHAVWMAFNAGRRVKKSAKEYKKDNA